MIDGSEGALPNPTVSKFTIDNLRGKGGEKNSIFLFLGLNEDYAQRVREDTQTLQHLGLSHEQVSSALKQVLNGGSGTKHKTQSDIIVSATDTHGSQTCPYESCDSKASFDYDAHHENNGMKWDHLSELHPHLIQEHHFFEGRQSAYRLEPIDAVLLTGIPVERKLLISEALNQLRTLGQEDGISLSTANNLFILCQDEPELPNLLNNFIDTIQESPNKKNSLINVIQFLRYKTSGNEDRFTPIIDRVVSSIINWDRDDKLKFQTIRRVLKKDTNHQIVAGVFLPDLVSVLPEKQQKYLKEHADQNDHLEGVISDGQKYWNTGFENLAKRKLDRLDHDGRIRGRNNNFTKLKNTTKVTDIQNLKNLFDSEFPDSFDQALASAKHTGWVI